MKINIKSKRFKLVIMNQVIEHLKSKNILKLNKILYQMVSYILKRQLSIILNQMTPIKHCGVAYMHQAICIFITNPVL